MDVINHYRTQIETTGTKRVNLLLGIDHASKFTQAQLDEIPYIRNSRYGLGTKRDLKQVKAFTGIDLENRRMLENKCGNLYWVPYEQSHNYGVDDFFARSLTGRQDDMAQVESQLLRTSKKQKSLSSAHNRKMGAQLGPIPEPPAPASSLDRTGQFLGISVALVLLLAYRYRSSNKDLKQKQ